jgi:hypothetical protein
LDDNIPSWRSMCVAGLPAWAGYSRSRLLPC